MARIQFETFRGSDQWLLNKLAQKEPSCFNGIVRVKRFRVTVEEIEEGPEVIGKRLQDLYDGTNNMHDYGPLREEAERVGYKIKNR